MHCKKVILWLLLATMLTSAFACGKTEGAETNGETIAPVQETEAVVETDAETEAVFAPIELDLGGGDFNVFLSGGSKMPYTEETGDAMGDAIYIRNRRVEELYNFRFQYHVQSGGYSGWFKKLSGSITAGDNAYQLVGGESLYLVPDSMNGQFYDLNANPHIDFEKPWWPSNMMEVVNVGNKMFMANGHIDPLFYDNVFAIYFNQQIATDNGVEDLYELVREGKWTLDTFMGISETVSADLNGDGKMDANDRFGTLVESGSPLDSFLISCDIQLTQLNEEGLPELLPLTEKYVNLQSTLDSFLHDSGYAWCTSGGDEKIQMFKDQKGLFLLDKLGRSFNFRDMEENFGILPHPKYDEVQDGYYTRIAPGLTNCFVIPVTTDEANSGAVLEALAAYGYTNILPVYYDQVLKGKTLRDEASAEMMDIVYNNITFNFIQTYDLFFENWISPFSLMRETLKNGRDLVSLWTSNEQKFETTVAKIIEKMQ